MDTNMQFTINSFRQLFPDKIFPLTFSWFSVKSLTFPWQLSIFLTFPGFLGFPDKWSPYISPYLSEKSSNFDEILYTAADFELDKRHVIKNEKVVLDRLQVRQNVFLALPACILFVPWCHRLTQVSSKLCSCPISAPDKSNCYCAVSR